MTKLFFLVVVIAALAICINADADPIADPQFPGFGMFPSFPGFQFSAFPPIHVMSPDDITNLAAKDPNAHVVGALVTSHSSSETVNGVPVKNVNRERVVTNNDGKVTDNTYEN